MPFKISESLMTEIVDGLQRQGFVYVRGVLNNKYDISKMGIEYLQAIEEKVGESEFKEYMEKGDEWISNVVITSEYISPTAWKEPDDLGEISISKKQEAVRLLIQCIQIIEESDLSQSEKAQAIGLMNACKNILEAPTPKLGFVKRIVEQLSHIADIASLVRRVIELIT
jgi:hypothetical protein